MELKGADAVIKKLETMAKKMGGGTVKIGYIGGEIYPYPSYMDLNAKPPYPAVADVAFWNEFGVGVPMRPFFRTTIAQELPNLPKKMAEFAKSNNNDTKKVLENIGKEMQEAIRTNIRTWENPPNGDYTVAKKGFNDPLVYKGFLQECVTYEVET